MKYMDMIAYATQGAKDIRITVGMIRDGEKSITCYGPNGKIINKNDYLYEIGSLTKVFTVALLCKALSEGRIELSAPISEYMSLPKGKEYPTVFQLATHTSGCGMVYHKTVVLNTVLRKNPYTDYSKEDITNTLQKMHFHGRIKWDYSNFGMALLGTVLGNVYDNTYADCMEAFIREDLGLKNTRFGDGNGDLKPYWSWKRDDVYLAAGGLVSTMDDMLSFTELHMDQKLDYISQAIKPYVPINRRAKMGLRFDASGLGWILDRKNGIVWHNGGTDHFNSYMGYDRKNKLGVIILANCKPGYKIPMTIIGPNIILENRKQKK